MAESQRSSGSRSRSSSHFLTTTYEMLEDPSTDSIVSWSEHGRSFIVWDIHNFSKNLLPTYFKHNNFSNFVRQLNTYGFRKIDRVKWEFANGYFVRGQPHLLKNIHRKKPVRRHSLQNVQAQENEAPLTESERQRLNDQIKTLRAERDSVFLQLESMKREKQKYGLQVQAMNHKLQHLNVEQQNMFSLLTEALKESPSALHLLQQSGKNGRKRRLSNADFFLDEAFTENNQMATTQVLSQENGDGAALSPFNLELLDHLESSMSFMEDFVHSLWQVTSKSASCSECPSDGDAEFSDAEFNCDDFLVDLDALDELIDTDGNTEPIPLCPSQPIASKEEGPTTNNPPFPTGYNSPFWQQFLTEFPGASRQAEDDSEGGKYDSMPGYQK